MPKLSKRHNLITCILAAIFLLFASVVSAEALPAQDAVFLVDSSQSASPYLHPLAGIMSRFVSGARAGDSFVCYQFSNKPVLIAQGRIGATGDIHRLRRQLVHLRADTVYTNYHSALQEGFKHIRDSFLTRPDNERLLVLITDGRRDPSDVREEINAFRRLREQTSHLEPGTDYSFYCFYLIPELPGDLNSYLLSVGAYVTRWPEDIGWLDQLTLADIHISDTVKNLGEIPDAPFHGNFSMTLYPRRPPTGISMLELSIEADFAKGTLDRFFNVRPRRLVCQQEPWTETFGYETRGFARGDYRGAFDFQPSDPKSMLLAPHRVEFSFSVAESLGVSLSQPLNFGPTGLKDHYEETRRIFITPSGADFPDSLDAVSVAAEIELPEGVQLKALPRMRGKEIIVEIALVRSQDLPGRARGEYEGKIRLFSSAGWAFTEPEIPLSVKVAPRGIDYGRVFLVIALVVGGTLLLGGLLLLSGSVRSAVSDRLAHKTRPVGKLIVTDDPTRGIARNVNLDRLSEERRKKDIVVGVGEGADVELPHRSMMDRRYKFSGIIARDEVKTIVEATKGANEVLVNGVSRTGQVQLINFDKVKLGGFEFRYEVPSPLRQTVLYYLGGEVLQGWPLSWNPAAEGFHLLSRSHLPNRQEMYVRFYELKAVAFVRDFEGELTRRLLSLKVPRSGHLMKITFADEEELTGYVHNWKQLGEKFYFFPDSMGENVLFFLIEKTTLKNIKLLAEDVRGAIRAQRKFARILDQMKRETEEG